jgi:hypothetical protein
MRMPPCLLQLPQRVCAEDRLSLGVGQAEQAAVARQPFAEMRQRALLQGAHRQLAEVGLGARFEHQLFADPAHAVGAGHHAHLGLAVEHGQARAVAHGDMARAGGVRQLGQLLQHPLAMFLDEGLDLVQAYPRGAPMRRPRSSMVMVKRLVPLFRR